MTPKDLKVFDICKFRNGNFGIVFPNLNDEIYSLALFSQYASCIEYLKSYDDLLHCNFSKELDIMKVYRGITQTYFARISNDFFNEKISDNYLLKNCSIYKLFWSRQEPKKLTISEISKLLGYEVEIVAEKVE